MKRHLLICAVVALVGQSVGADEKPLIADPIVEKAVREAREKSRRSGENREAMRERLLKQRREMAERFKKQTEKFEAILTVAQKKKLAEARTGIRPLDPGRDPYAALNLTDDQKKMLTATRNAQRKEMQESTQEWQKFYGNANREGTREKLTKADFEKVTELVFFESQITDDGLKEVAKLQKLEKLVLQSSYQFTDSGLKEVAKLQKLKELLLPHTKITNDGLKEVAKLQNLTFLDLTGCQVSNYGLGELVKLQKLEKLYLHGCARITDAGLKKVAKLQKLKELAVSYTQITKAGVAELQKALPNCKIAHDAKK